MLSSAARPMQCFARMLFVTDRPERSVHLQCRGSAPMYAAMLALAMLVVAGRAPAQTSGDKAAAEALFRNGVELFNAGKYNEACSKFEASQRIDAGLGTQLYLADCYEKMGKLASAWATFREAESIAKGRGDSQRSEVARGRAEKLEPRLPKLWLKVTEASDPNLVVTRDGAVVPRESWGIALPVDPGEHLIEAKAPQKKPFSTKVTVSGERGEVEVTIPALAAAPDEASSTSPAPSEMPETPMQDAPPEPSNGSGQRTAGLIVGGIGVVGLVVGGIFGLQAKSKNDDSLDECRTDDASLCSAEGVALRDDARTAATVSTVAMAVGGAALVGGIVLYLTAPSDTEVGGAPLRVAATATPNAAFMSLRGGW